MLEDRGGREVKVVHRHRVGQRTPFTRVSELVFIGERAMAVLGWIDMGGVRTPLYSCELDKSRLRRGARKSKGRYYYDGVTDDPRYLEVVPHA